MPEIDGPFARAAFAAWSLALATMSCQSSVHPVGGDGDTGPDGSMDADTDGDADTDPDVPTFCVTNTADSGGGSLREAIGLAQDVGSAARVEFCIPTTDSGFDSESGVWTIRLATPLPSLQSGSVTIDAETQVEMAGDTNPNGPEVALRAASSGIEHAIAFLSADNGLRGVAIGGFVYGVVMYGAGASGNVVAESFIGVDPGGGSAIPNDSGVLITESAHDNRIEGCLVSGNLSAGVYVGGVESTGNRILGSSIGTTASGTGRLPNGVGVILYKSASNIVGAAGEGQGNTISGNTDSGVLITGKGAEGNIVQGNRIGTDPTGEQLVYNDKGIVLKALANGNRIGGSGAGEGNVISGNLEIGIYIEAADDNVIQGNMLGPNATGTSVVTDGTLVQGNGIEFNTVAKNNLLGGTAAGEGNVVSGNTVYGVVYYGNCSNNDTVGNLIGSDATGEVALPNATGICFDCASHDNDVADNVISGNMSYGMFFVTRGTEGNTLRNNKIGTNRDGTAALPNDIGLVIATGAANNVVGGGAADRNIISGNNRSGVMITNRLTEGNVVRGNYIGLNAAGTAPIANEHGVMLSTFPSLNTVDGNVISGNGSVGVLVLEEANENTISDNDIGPGAGGEALGNGQIGVLFDWEASFNLLGGLGRGNRIAYNGSGGVLFQEWAGVGNTLSENEIWGNGGSAVDIFPYGFNSNDPGDADDGPNGLMNSPSVSSADFDAGSGELHVTGTLDTADPSGATVEVFAVVEDGSGGASSMTFVGRATPGADGSFSVLATGFEEVDAVTATATDEEGSTSEMSALFPVP